MEWTDLLWGAIWGVISGTIIFIIWLVQLEGRTGPNKREIDITNEKIALVNVRVGANETLLAEVGATAITKTNLKEVEERVTKSVDAVGRQVTGEIDRLIRVIDGPTSRTGSK